jgi:hypothetical protein
MSWSDRLVSRFNDRRDTGGNAAGRATMQGNADAMWLRGALSTFQAELEIPGTHVLGDHAQVMAGFFRDGVPATNPRGAFLLYDLGTDLPEKDRWIAYATANSIAERIATPVVVQPSMFYRLRIEVEARPGAQAKASFFIDDVLAATLQTSLPLGTTDTLTAGLSIVKQGGTTNRFTNLDYLFLRQQWAARGAA